MRIRIAKGYILESIHKRIIIVLTVVFLFVISNGWASDKIFLNSGEIVEGEIVHETPIFVRIRTIANKTEEYLQSRIDHLEFEPLDDDIEQKDSSLSESTNTPENTVDTIILKTGRIVKGKIIRQTPIFVRIQTDAALGIENFMIEHIERINTDDILEQKDPSMDISQEVIKTDANILTVPNTATETIPLENKIVPYSKVISRDSPEPSSSQDYRRINDPITSNSGQSYQNAAPNMKNFEEVQKEIAKLENASLSDQVSKGDMANIVTETPHIFNTEAYNDFLDQTITTSNYKRENTHQQQSALLKQAMEARANAASGGAQGSLDKAKEMIPEFLMAIVIGAGVPILIGIVFLIICIGKMTLNQGENKEVDDELKSLSSLKEENKISDEEYNNLTAEAKKHLSESPVKTFLQSVPRIFIYPVRGKVLLSTLGATVVFYIFRIAMYAPFYGFFAMIFAFCYFVACIVKIIETAVTEEREDIFDWPSFTDMVDWFGKAFLFLIGWLICHGTVLQ